MTTKLAFNQIEGAYTNVLDYGADNTGTAPAWQQIQNAIDAVPDGGTVYIPSGTYSFGTTKTNTLNILKSIKVVMEKGTILDKTVDGGMLNIQDTVNVEIHGGVFRHTRAATGTNTVYVLGSQKVKFFRTQFLYSPKDCVYLGESLVDPINNINEGIYFNDCEFLSGRRQGVSIIAGRSIYFDGCLFKDILGDPPEAGVDIEANESTIGPTEHIYFTNCKFIDLATNGGIFNATGQYVSVTTSEFRNCAFGVHVAAVQANTESQEITLVDNTTDRFTVAGHGLTKGDIVNFTTVGGGSLPAGITGGVAYRVFNVLSVDVFTVSAYYDHVPINITTNGTLPLQVNKFREDRAANTIVDGNHFTGTTAFAVYGEVGFDYIVTNNTMVSNAGGNSVIGLNNVDRAIVSNNIIRGLDGEGIFLSGIDGQIKDNTIIGNSQTDEGIRCFGGHNVAIDGNKMIDCGNVPDTVMSVRYFDEGSISGNQVENRSGLNPNICLNMNGSDSRYNTVDDNNFYNSCASDATTMLSVDSNFNFVGDNNTLTTGVKYTGHFLSSTGELDDITSDINTFGKYEGKMQFNQTSNKPVYAVGSAAGDVWVDGAGTTINTPV
jgi:hypothetical protein